MATRKNQSAEGSKPTKAQRQAQQDNVVDHGTDHDEGVDHDLVMDRENAEPDWAPAANLWAPPPPPGISYRWIRVSSRAGADRNNFVKKSREGWKPVRPSDLQDHHGNLLAIQSIDGISGEVFATGDLVLCARPQRMTDQRNRYYKNKRDQQTRSIQGTNLKAVMEDQAKGTMPADVTVNVKTEQGRVPKVADG